MRLLALGMLASVLALSASAGAAQSVERGALLAAAPEITSFRFERSIIFVVHHDDNGSLGLIVNRPTHLAPAETFAELDGLERYEGRVFIGGPIEATRPLLLLNDTRGFLAESDPVFDSIHIAAEAELVRRHAEELTDESTLRVYAGHVQWESGQLEAEIADGHWRVIEGSVDAVFSDSPLTLYDTLASRGSELVAASAPSRAR